MALDKMALRKSGIKAGVGILALVAGKGGVNEVADSLNGVVDASGLDSEGSSPPSSGSSSPSSGSSGSSSPSSGSSGSSSPRPAGAPCKDCADKAAKPKQRFDPETMKAISQ